MEPTSHIQGCLTMQIDSSRGSGVSRCRIEASKQGVFHRFRALTRLYRRLSMPSFFCKRVLSSAKRCNDSGQTTCLTASTPLALHHSG